MGDDQETYNPQDDIDAMQEFIDTTSFTKPLPTNPDGSLPTLEEDKDEI